MQNVKEIAKALHDVIEQIDGDGIWIELSSKCREGYIRGTQCSEETMLWDWRLVEALLLSHADIAVLLARLVEAALENPIKRERAMYEELRQAVESEEGQRIVAMIKDSSKSRTSNLEVALLGVNENRSNTTN